MRPAGRLVAGLALGLGILAAPAARSEAADCCAFASTCALEIRGTLASPVPGPGARGGIYGKALGKAVESLEDGIAEGSAGCTDRAARRNFQNALGWLEHAARIADQVDGDDGEAVLLMARVDGLVAGVCEDGPALPLE